MSEMLKMRSSDLKKLMELLENPGDKKYCEEYEKRDLYNLCPENWESSKVAWFNEDFEHGDIPFLWLADLLYSLKMPYEFFADGDIEFDDYWEFYNPTIHEVPKQVNVSKDFTSYLFKEWNFKELKDLPPVEFKQAVEAFFTNPFSEYPSLEKIED